MYFNKFNTIVALTGSRAIKIWIESFKERYTLNCADWDCVVSEQLISKMSEHKIELQDAKVDLIKQVRARKRRATSEELEPTFFYVNEVKMHLPIIHPVLLLQQYQNIDADEQKPGHAEKIRLLNLVCGKKAEAEAEAEA